MKLSDILEGDVVDFGAKKQERDFINNISTKQRDHGLDVDAIAADIDAADARDQALAMDVQRKYGPQMREMQAFLKRPVMSGGFKSGYDLNDALKSWRHRLTRAPEKLRRAIQKAAADDELYRNVQKHNALWHAITNKFPMEVIWVMPNIDDFEVLEELDANLEAARKYFLGK